MNDEHSNNEQDLLAQVASGNEQAFRKVCEHYSPLLYTTVFHLTRQQWLADEIVQDSLLKVWIHRAELPEILNFKGWLYRIASNLTINAIKKARREKEESDRWQDFISGDLSSAGAAPAQPEVYWELLADAVNRLPPRQRETYRLIKEQKLSRKEVAEIMQVSPETVKWNLEQAIRNIRAYCMSKIGIVLAVLAETIDF